ncbi:MAG: hypothetical protein ACOCV2_00030 [Persicimonas sp.]
MKWDQIKDSRPIRLALLFSLFVLLLLSASSAKLSLESSELRFPTPTDADRYLLPESDVLSALFLNYDNAAADIVWMQALIYYGEQEQRQQGIEHLEKYAYTVSKLDPHFYRVYKWFADIYLTSRFIYVDDAIETANRFLDRGMEYFPDKHELPYTAALNYIGYSTHKPAEVRFRESERAIEYLEKVVQMDDAPPNAILLLDYFHRRKQRLADEIEGEEVSSETRKLTDDQRELYARMYLLSEDASIRSRIEQMIERRGGERDEFVEQVEAYADQLEEARAEQFSYVPVDLWTTLIGEPIEQ